MPASTVPMLGTVPENSMPVVSSNRQSRRALSSSTAGSSIELTGAACRISPRPRSSRCKWSQCPCTPSSGHAVAATTFWQRFLDFSGRAGVRRPGRTGRCPPSRTAFLRIRTGRTRPRDACPGRRSPPCGPASAGMASHCRRRGRRAAQARPAPSFRRHAPRHPPVACRYSRPAGHARPWGRHPSLRVHGTAIPAIRHQPCTMALERQASTVSKLPRHPFVSAAFLRRQATEACRENAQRLGRTRPTGFSYCGMVSIMGR